ncbi:ribonucleoprotein PTB-binding 2 isoform X2 [Anguilla anguilla]|uniref:ribonucleoprotein PTB-binding 2 isoform X2 n=1 Tax=Anguilla anguilla TaxID=7936 RepID=UPI0015B083CE|nr:ribonucleoprotein PTB-binding 2 isoform X2 [Anguilla anguilla]
MAAASSIQPPSVHALNQENTPFQDSDSPESRQDEDTTSDGPCLRVLSDLEPEEIERRLEKTRRELSNRRKILIKNLPQDITNQEVHDILREYELKYCYVDRNKGTAFVTLLNGDQAQDAIRSFHQTSIRGREITVQLQPTDSLLCVTNLAHTFTGAQFEELVRAYGNIERCFLVYSELTGHSKGYGFVEYMKKDSASRARTELLGKPQGDRALMVQWTDVNQLTAEHLHSKCLCVDKLPLDFCDTDQLAHIFSSRYKPVFCQLAQDEDSHVRGFAVVEYETAEQAEAMLTEMDRQLIGGQEIRVSLCSPGTSGRSTLAALIAAQGVMSSNKKGLLPEPSLAQLLSSMSNPAALQVLMRPYQAAGGKRGGKFGRPQGLPFLRPPLTAALLQLGKVQQNALLGNGLVLQNLLQMQLAQQQLLQIKDKHISNVPSLLGDPSRLLLQKAMGLRTTAPMPLGKGLLGDSPNEVSQDPLQTAPAQGPGAAGGMMPYMPGRQHLGAPGGGEQNGASASDKQPPPPPPPATSAASGPLAQSFLQGMGGPVMGALLPPGAAPKAQQGLQCAGDSAAAAGMAQGSPQTSLLGEPPKELKLPSNPYLNLASVLPGMVLQAPACSKAQSVAPHSAVYSSVLAPASQPPTQAAAQYGSDTSTDYTQQYSQQYSQEAMQQWYQHYQAQSYSTAPPETTGAEYGKEQAQGAGTTSYGDYSTYMQAVNQYYSQTQMSQAAAQAYQHRDASKEPEATKAPPAGALHPASNGSAHSLVPGYGPVPVLPGYIGVQQAPPGPAPHPQSGQAAAAAAAAAEWNQYYYNQARGQKREYSQLPLQDAGPDGAYVGQHSQGLGGQYADYYKKKRI